MIAYNLPFYTKDTTETCVSRLSLLGNTHGISKQLVHEDSQTVFDDFCGKTKFRVCLFRFCCFQGSFALLKKNKSWREGTNWNFEETT